MDWKRIEAQYYNTTDTTVSVTIRDLEGGAEQTILSNRIHPYFLQTTRAVVASSEGRVYTGDLAGGHWVDAAHLHPGDRLLNDDASWAEVVAVGVEARPLTAYNLTVADFHTYFVAATPNAAPVWVHNNCWDALPNGAATTGRQTAFGQDIYTLNGTEIYRGHDGRFYNARVYPPTAGTIQARVVINRQNGLEFERQILASLAPVGGVKNTTPKTVTLSNGTVVTTIPDLWDRTVGGLLEAKNVINVPWSDQLKGQAEIARKNGQPMNLVVSQRTQKVHPDLLKDVESTGGNVYIYDPVNDAVRPW